MLFRSLNYTSSASTWLVINLSSFCAIIFHAQVMPALVDLRVCYQNYDSCTNLCALSIMVLTKRRAYTLSLNLCTTRAIWILIFLFALCNCTFVSIPTQDCIRFLKIAPLHDILTFIVLVQTGGLTREVVVLNSWTIGSREMFRFLTDRKSVV